MNTQENIYPKTNCLALTVRKEHRLMLANQVAQTSARVSLKVVFAIFALNILNLIF